MLRFAEGPGAAMAWTPMTRFTDGDIDVDAKGRDLYQKSFVGLAFHVMDDTTYDVVWLRPFNFHGADSAHHAHALQAASYPTYSWEFLRGNYPGVYESAVTPTPDPNGWVHMRVSVSGPRVRVYVNGAATPTLDVRMRSGLTQGGIGLWVGDMSDGDFANLTISPTAEP